MVRELLLGPKRYGELAEALPAMGTNLLAARLRRLESAGIIGAREEGGYELTARGRELEPAVLALARWGLAPLPARDDAKTFRPGWLMLSLQAMFKPEEAVGVHETWEYRIGDETFWVRVDDGSIRAGAGGADDPDIVWTTDADTFRALGARRLSPLDAIASGTLRAEGAPATIERALRIVPPPGA